MTTESFHQGFAKLDDGVSKFMERQTSAEAQRGKYSSVHRAQRRRVLESQRAHGFKYQGATSESDYFKFAQGGSTGSNDQYHAYHQNAHGADISEVQLALKQGDVHAMRRITQLYLMYVLTEDHR